MASLPSQASRRRSSPTEQASSPAPQSTEIASNTSSNTQSILLNNPQSASITGSATSSSQPPPQPPQESRRCWICQQEDTEDTPESSEWRTPCPCSLTAHDSCLLEWVADQESKPGLSAPSSKLVCPQCQAKINIQRPRDPIVITYDVVRRLAKEAIVPTVLSGLIGCAYSGLLVYGLNTIHLVFGAEEARRLLGANIGVGRLETRTLRGVVGRLFHAMDPFFPSTLYAANYSLFLALPLIGPSLVLLRTKYSDQAFALILPIYFLNTRSQWDLSWPPTPGLTFATIPFLKTAYSGLYQYTFASLEKQWDRAVQRKPREGETAEQIEQQAEVEEHIFNMEWVEEDIEIPEGGNVDVNEQQPAVPRGDGGLNPEIAEVLAANAENPPAAQRRVQNGWEIRHDVSVSFLATTVMGALFFPAVSSIMGDLLKYTLPSRYVRYGVGGRGLLKEKWGRSIVGGCLFVVLKDVVTLYVKWRKAKDFGKRKILDYTGKRGSAKA